MSNKQPLVSVILPNYNHAQYLQQRIESILNQTFQDFELIILDDCSTDNSVDIIRKYAESKKVSHLIVNKENSGSTFLQWEKGFHLARGRYIWIAESDDYADPVFLETLINLLENTSSSCVAYCYSNLIDENGNILSDDWDRSHKTKYKVKVFDGKDFVKAWMLFNNTIYNTSMGVFRKDASTKIGTEYTKYKYSGDWYFWNRLCLEGKVIRCCDKLNYYRQHTEKVTSKADLEGLGFIESKYIIEDLIRRLCLTSIQRKIVIGWFMKRIVISKLFRNKDIKKKVLSDIQSYFKCGISSIYIYKLDKRLNFSSLNIKKNRSL
ncbi:glycosyltransferase [Dysgonomonas sp. Marseille-P4677]|uniref:glycosyltransferase family 2 protein n=1 Tax=Dysgonomonas sp. Marseille-P4677 TaxID=2364790 RepID=UPI0019113F12|nr:glycosyltransferase [Dysgonomonas sp. Marseille-P4677]MBK5721226.1 glycosyltransferase [Dysgonomonas sp. Marseille-P4677]